MNELQKRDEPVAELATRQETPEAQTSSVAIAARERAKIEAAYIMAERHPRNWDTVRVRLMDHCKRLGFAEAARYEKPVGKKFINGQWVEQKVEGWSARFAETARQEMGNMMAESSVVYEDELIRIIRAGVIDLERNNIDVREVTITKATDKRGIGKEGKPPDGREIINQRVNSKGEKTYLVRATAEEVKNLSNSEISKIQRDCTVRMIPKDLLADVEALAVSVIEKGDSSDPAASRKRLIDSFAQFGVMPDDLVTYVGGPLDRLTPADLNGLRLLWTAIKEGELTFNEALRQKYDTQQQPAEESAADRDIRLQRQMKAQTPTQEQMAAERIEHLRREEAELLAAREAGQFAAQSRGYAGPQATMQATEAQMREWREATAARQKVEPTGSESLPPDEESEEDKMRRWQAEEDAKRAAIGRKLDEQKRAASEQAAEKQGKMGFGRKV